MKSLRERFTAAFAADKTKTKAGLARACGISKGAVTKWFDGTTLSLQDRNSVVASAYLGVLPTWLATGRGPMKEGQDHASRAGCALLTNVIDIPSIDGTASIPVYADHLAKSGLNPANLRALTCDDDAMLPQVVTGALVLIDIKDAVPAGYIYAIRYADKLIIRRLIATLRGIRIIADNPDGRMFPDESFAPGEIEVIGRAVYVIGRI